jgi:hypothetical protein
MRNAHFRIWNIARYIEKHGKWDMLTVGPEYGQKKKNLEYKTQKLYDMEHVGKLWKTLKMKNVPYSPGIWRAI